MNVLIPNVAQQLSFSKVLSTSEWQSKTRNVLSLTVAEPSRMRTVIRMGGGPRTYPGGVSKWQWKRMQAKKAKQLLKARLCRERQIYEMRKRAELKAAVSELERPWEVVEKAPKLFSVSADEQVKVLADRFQKPGGFDLWSERDGPQLFETPDELPSARFFPKGVVHSIKPYRKVDANELMEGPDVEEDDSDGEYSSDFSEDGDGFDDGESGSSSPLNYGRNRVKFDGRLRKNRSGRRFLSEDVGRSNDGERSSPMNYGRNGLNVGGRLGNKGSGRMILSKDGDRSDASDNSRLRRKGNERRFVSKGVDGSNEMYSGRDSGREQRGSNSIAGRRGGRYTRRTSPRVRDVDSEVYDMGLQQDGSYGFLQKSEQSDSTNW
ncbi:ATP binding protein [Sesbania bispinosa]|nr:ATP binding protein [Sesbania bispinosa]